MVGNSGSIALYNNNIWSKINSKTSTDIIDIWGLQDKAGSYTELYVPRGSLMMLDKYNDATVFPILPEMHVFSVWAKNIHKIYAAGNGLYIYTNGLWKKDMHEGVQSLYRVRGNNCNDMFGVGGNGSVVYHFNGYTWQPIYTETANVFGSLTVKGNTIVAVGYRAGTQNAIVTIIRRSN
jgi:hypothetical protein